MHTQDEKSVVMLLYLMWVDRVKPFTTEFFFYGCSFIYYLLPSSGQNLPWQARVTHFMF